MTRYRTPLMTFLLLCLPLQAQAWEAIDTMTGKRIKVEWPERVIDLQESESQQITYRFIEETTVRLGQVTEWIPRCEGPYCLSDHSKVFRLETFSSAGVLVLLPLKK